MKQGKILQLMLAWAMLAVLLSGTAGPLSYTEFSANMLTTDLSGIGADDENVSGLVIGDNSYIGMISFADNVSLNSSYDLDAAISIGYGYVYVNSTMYPAFDKPANITLNGLQLGYPRILKDGADCTDCELLYWNTDWGTLRFNVTGFSNYTIVENESTQSKIVNNATNTSLYLLIKVQFYNESLSAWVDDDIVYNSTEPMTISNSSQVKLDDYFNGKWHTEQNASHGDGWYRIVAYGLDNESNVLKNIDGTDVNATYNFSIALANAAPVIGDISFIEDQEITESGVTWVNFTVIASDSNGVGDLDDTSLNASFSMAGQDTRSNQSCSWIADINATSAVYSCTIGIWYWDASGWWSVNATVKDTAGLMSDMYNESFWLMETTAITASPAHLTWPQLNSGNTDTLSDENILINNTGNDDISLGGVRVQAFDLLGEDDPSHIMPAANFSINTVEACGGTVLANNTAVGIAGSVLAAGNNSAGLGQEALYVCMEEVPYGLMMQDYSASSMWVIDVT